jgi:hypothetical protein
MARDAGFGAYEAREPLVFILLRLFFDGALADEVVVELDGPADAAFERGPVIVEVAAR